MTKSVPENIRSTETFMDAQKSEGFQAWLKYQDAAFDLEFSMDLVPELPADPFNAEGLAVAERKALNLWESPNEAFSDESRSSAYQFIYFLGETFVRSFEGKWVNLPLQHEGKTITRVDIDLPFNDGFYDPRGLFRLALARRSGEEWSFVYHHAAKNYDKWVAAGRPERVLE